MLNSISTRDHFRGTWFIESLSKVNKMLFIPFLEFFALPASNEIKFSGFL